MREGEKLSRTSKENETSDELQQLFTALNEPEDSSVDDGSKIRAAAALREYLNNSRNATSDETDEILEKTVAELSPAEAVYFSRALEFERQATHENIREALKKYDATRRGPGARLNDARAWATRDLSNEERNVFDGVLRTRYYQAQTAPLGEYYIRLSREAPVQEGVGHTTEEKISHRGAASPDEEAREKHGGHGKDAKGRRRTTRRWVGREKGAFVETPVLATNGGNGGHEEPVPIVNPEERRSEEGVKAVQNADTGNPGGNVVEVAPEVPKKKPGEKKRTLTREQMEAEAEFYSGRPLDEDRPRRRPEAPKDPQRWNRRDAGRSGEQIRPRAEIRDQTPQVAPPPITGPRAPQEQRVPPGRDPTPEEVFSVLRRTPEGEDPRRIPQRVGNAREDRGERREEAREMPRVSWRNFMDRKFSVDPETGDAVVQTKRGAVRLAQGDTFTFRDKQGKNVTLTWLAEDERPRFVEERTFRRITGLEETSEKKKDTTSKAKSSEKGTQRSDTEAPREDKDKRSRSEKLLETVILSPDFEVTSGSKVSDVMKDRTSRALFELMLARDGARNQVLIERLHDPSTIQEGDIIRLVEQNKRFVNEVMHAKEIAAAITPETVEESANVSPHFANALRASTATKIAEVYRKMLSVVAIADPNEFQKTKGKLTALNEYRNGIFAVDRRAIARKWSAYGLSGEVLDRIINIQSMSARRSALRQELRKQYSKQNLFRFPMAALKAWRLDTETKSMWDTSQRELDRLETEAVKSLGMIIEKSPVLRRTFAKEVFGGQKEST